MAKLRYSTRALGDLERISTFLSKNSAPEALHVLDLITEAITILSRHPLIGRQIESGLTELVISRGRTGYVALYSHEKAQDAVLILSIRHQREAGFHP